MGNNEQEEFEFRLRAEREAAAQKQPKDWKQVVGTAAKEAFTRPAAAAKDLGTNPVTMSRALPYVAGAAGGMSGIPMGTTMGTAAGRGISDLALKGLNRSDLIPSGTQQGLEIGGAALGDVAAVPFMHKAAEGANIGKAEAAAGLGAVGQEAPPSGARTAVKFIQGLKGKEFSPQEAKRLKPAVDWIFAKGWLKGTAFEPEAVKVSQAIQSSLNQIPARAAPAARMATAMAVPRKINQIYQMIPSSVRRGLGYGTGVGLSAGSAFELIKHLMGG